MSTTEEEAKPAPWPYSWESSGKPGGNGDLNFYIIDANKRKIAAVWGKRGEKEKTANLLMASGDFYAAAGLFRQLYTPGQPLPPEVAQALFDALNVAEGRTP